LAGRGLTRTILPTSGQVSHPSLPICGLANFPSGLQKRHDWTPELSLDLTRQITLDKFCRSPNLCSLYLATRHELIVAENNWHEQFWGLALQHSRANTTERLPALCRAATPWKDSNVCKRPAHLGSARPPRHTLLERLPPTTHRYMPHTTFRIALQCVLPIAAASGSFGCPGSR